jgi:hypothetical protein
LPWQDNPHIRVGFGSTDVAPGVEDASIAHPR